MHWHDFSIDWAAPNFPENGACFSVSVALLNATEARRDLKESVGSCCCESKITKQSLLSLSSSFLTVHIVLNAGHTLAHGTNGCKIKTHRCMLLKKESKSGQTLLKCLNDERIERKWEREQVSEGKWKDIRSTVREKLKQKESFGRAKVKKAC